MYTSSRNRTTVVVFLIVLAVGALILHQVGSLRPFEAMAINLLQPLLGGTIEVKDGAQAATGSFADVNALRQQIAQLQAQVDEMTLNSVRLRELESENATFRAQLGYKQSNPDFDVLGGSVLERNPDLAHIVSVDPSNLVRFIVLDQGSDDGVESGMPVVTPQGLVGRVTDVGPHWSKVLLITDPSSSVQAVVQSTRATGVVQGQGDPNGNLLIKYVPQGEAIKVGDLILTSGMGGNFPKRLVIGEVTEVHKRDNELFQEAVVVPTVDFARLEFVLILKKFTPSDITTEPTPTPTPRPTRTPTPRPTETPPNP